MIKEPPTKDPKKQSTEETVSSETKTVKRPSSDPSGENIDEISEIVGKSQIVKEALKLGEEVYTARKSTGKTEKGWFISTINEDGTYDIDKPSEGVYKPHSPRDFIWKLSEREYTQIQASGEDKNKAIQRSQSPGQLEQKNNQPPQKLKKLGLWQIINVPSDRIETLQGLKSATLREKWKFTKICRRINGIGRKSKIELNLEIYRKLKDILDQMKKEGHGYRFEQSEQLLESYGEEIANQIEVLASCADALNEYINDRSIAESNVSELKRQGVSGMSGDIVALEENIERLLSLYEAQKSLDVFEGFEQEEKVYQNNKSFNRLDQPQVLDLEARHLEHIVPQEQIESANNCIMCCQYLDSISPSTSAMSKCFKMIGFTCNHHGKHLFEKYALIPYMVAAPSVTLLSWLTAWIMNLAESPLSETFATIGVIAFCSLLPVGCASLVYDDIRSTRNKKSIEKKLQPQYQASGQLIEFRNRLSVEKERVEKQLDLLNIQAQGKTLHKQKRAQEYAQRLLAKRERVEALIERIKNVLSYNLCQLEEKTFIIATQLSFNRRSASLETGKFKSSSEQLQDIQKQFDELLLQKEIIENEGL